VPKLTRLKAVPWTVAMQAGLVASEHWRQLSDHERSRLLGLVRDARGWPGNLTTRERDELKKLVGKLDVPGMGRDLFPLARSARSFRRKSN
jgi:hypothetical protein